ncbi:hypothetical protein FDG09_13195 [Clostridium sporogenes]|uniref:hypothetical protein n=1 Tax=Clostridium sporogenes TaxID=1509 RepID=UPI0013D34549|nr:hypothetical protein [Clostridium sporogenes]NFV13830.1 hypothetical protein [Clostridium sporogenes]
MKENNKFLDGVKQELGVFSKESIFLTLDEYCFNMDELGKNIVKHLKNEGKDCSYVGSSAGRPIILLNDKKYIAKLSNYGNGFSIVPCQKVILVPIKDK